MESKEDENDSPVISSSFYEIPKIKLETIEPIVKYENEDLEESFWMSKEPNLICIGAPQTEAVYHHNTDVDVDRLITAVQSKPVLWDKTYEKYKDKFKTQEAWKNVAAEIFKGFEEYDATRKVELGKQILKKWTQVRDSYRKSIGKAKAKSRTGAKAKTYVYASQLRFLDKIFEEKETTDNLSQNIDYDYNDGCVADITVGNDENSMQSVSNEPWDTATVEKPKLSFKKPASKKQKMNSVELEMNESLKETSNRHISFFKGILPSLEDFDEFDTIDFQIEVLKIVKKIRQRKHTLPSTSDMSYASPSVTPPI